MTLDYWLAAALWLVVGLIIDRAFFGPAFSQVTRALVVLTVPCYVMSQGYL